jgi:sodium/proline symporter
MEYLANTGDNIFIISIVSIYFSCLMYLGWRGYRSTKTFSDYILGSRKLGPVVGAMNVGASDMSSWLLMGLPGAFYLFGLNQIWMVVGLVSGSYFSWKFIARRLRSYTEIAGDSLTISSFLENRFEDKTKILSIVTSIVIIFFFTIYIASGFVGSAKLFSVVFDMSYQNALIISCVAIVSYALLGGFLAISWADLFQGILMLIVLLFTPLFAIYKSDLSVPEIYNKLLEISPTHLDAFSNLDWLGIIGFFAWGLGYMGQPHIISKYMAIKDVKAITLARRICISWMILAMIGAVLVGILGFLYFSDISFSQNSSFRGAMLEEPETVFIALANSLFHPIVIGVLISAILAATMSTINGQIIIACSALSQDFYRRFLRKKAKDKEMLIVTRLWVVLVAVVAALIACDQTSSVLELVARAWAGLGASVGPVILFSLFWKKMTKAAAVAGMISGSLGAIIFSKLSFISYEILPAFALASLLIYVVSLLTQNQIPSCAERDFKKLTS